MAIFTGIKNFITESPDLSNKAVVDIIKLIVEPEDSTENFISKVYELNQIIETTGFVPASNVADLQTSLDNHPYLNLGSKLHDLKIHTAKLLTGELGEIIQDDVQSTFLDHLSSVASFEAVIPTLYGTSADAQNKGYKSHFGSLMGELDQQIRDILPLITFINGLSLSEDTAYKNAIQDMTAFVTNLADSTAFEESTFNAKRSVIETTANSLNTFLNTNHSSKKTDLTTIRTSINSQITLEETNLSGIITYENTLRDYSAYVGFASNSITNSLFQRLSQNDDWKSYFVNYESNAEKDNVIYSNPTNDSSAENIIEDVMRFRGLPDVSDHENLEAVAKKALKDTRLKGKVLVAGVQTTEQIIVKSAELLNIETDRGIYAVSKDLLANMNTNDRDIVKKELDDFNSINTIN